MLNRVRVAAILVAIILTGFSGIGGAALPPRVQSINDLDVMVAFVRAHPRVAGSLVSIDMVNKVVHFRPDCRAQFARKEKLPGIGPIPGPAPVLEFKQSNCSLKKREDD